MGVRQVFAVIVPTTMLSVLPLQLGAGSSSSAGAEQDLRQLEQDIVAASVRGDCQFADRILAPDWTCIDHFGRQLDETAVLAAIKAKQAQIESEHVYDLQVRFVKTDLAVVTGRLNGPGQRQGENRDFHRPFHGHLPPPASEVAGCGFTTHQGAGCLRPAENTGTLKVNS